MSRHHTLPLLLLPMMLCAGYASAAYVSPSQALARLDRPGSHRVAALKSKTLDYTLETTVGDLYIFNSPDGFLILPDDDRAPALLAFSDYGSLQIDGNPALAAWLDFYNSELQSLHAAGVTSTTASPTAVLRAARADIAPLIKTEWNQESPYNMLCPKVNGHDVVTGCVATAMAQFMKYYNYPAKGKGTHSYDWKVGNETLALDYDTIPFQWDLMTDRYDASSSEASKEAVAQLMLACGISVDMHYDIGDSGAATTHMGVSLIDIFGYSPSLWMAHREYYGYDEWIGMIYDELAAGNPVLYSGQGTAGGHQFICDGFKGDGYFHFNWGWGGLSNGYFLLTALNPDDLGVGGGAGGFNTDQIATLGGRPAQDGDKPTYIMYNSGAFTPAVTTVKAGDDLMCEGTYFNYSMSALPDGATLGMKFTNAADLDDVRFVKGSGVAGLRLDEGRYYDIVKFPSLPDGTYYITPSLNADDKWSPVRMPLGTPDRITAVVTDGVATLTAETSTSITVDDIVVPGTVYAAHDFPMQFTARNDGDLEYYANVTPYMLDSTGTAVASSTFRPLDILPGATETVSDYVANFTAVSDATFGAGDYQLVFRDDSGKDVSEPLSVHVDTTTVATQIAISDFKLVTRSPVTDPSHIEFSFTIECQQGVYYSCPHILVFPGDGGYDRADFSGDSHYLPAGSSATVTITGDLDKLQDGNYMAAVYDDGRERSSFVRFEIHRVTTGITDPVATDGRAAVIYDLSGNRVTTPSPAQIYIIDGKKTFFGN